MTWLTLFSASIFVFLSYILGRIQGKCAAAQDLKDSYDSIDLIRCQLLDKENEIDMRLDLLKFLERDSY